MKINNFELPKLITPEIIESVIANKDKLISLFKLDDETMKVDGDNMHMSVNPKIIKFVLCDVEIYVIKEKNKEQTGHDKEIDNECKILINVSDLKNKKSIDSLEKQLKEIINKINNNSSEIEKLKEILYKEQEYKFSQCLKRFE